jgi:putative secretion ATPase (PEP-CTERM system associated)
MYADFYGLKTMPFMLTPDHRFFFRSAGHGRAMAHLAYGLGQGEGFIVITGDIGAGKTTVMTRFCATLDQAAILAVPLVSTRIGGTDLLRLVAASLGLAPGAASKGEILVTLQSFLVAAGAAGRRVLLIVDEAQNLSVDALEEMRMLSNFSRDGRTLFHSFLLGMPAFRALIARPELEQLRQRITAAFHLGPLDRSECEAYIGHRLGLAGWTGDPAFSPEAHDMIYAWTGGLPRRINTLCGRVLLYGCLEDMRRFTGADIARVASDLGQEGIGPAVQIQGGGLAEPERAAVTHA